MDFSMHFISFFQRFVSVLFHNVRRA